MAREKIKCGKRVVVNLMAIVKRLSRFGESKVRGLDLSVGRKLQIGCLRVYS